MEALEYAKHGSREETGELILEGQARKIRAKSNPNFQRSEKYLLLGGDFLALISAFFLGRAGYWFVHDISVSGQLFTWWGSLGSTRVALFAVLSLVALTWFWSAGHYSQRRPFWDELRQTTKILLTVAVMDAALVFLGDWPFSRLWFISTWILALALVPVFRVLLKRILSAMGGWKRPTVIIGTGPNAIEAAAALRSESLMGLDIVAFLALPSVPGKTTDSVEVNDIDIPVLPLGKSAEKLIERIGQPHLVIALEADASVEYQSLIRRLGRRYLNIHIVPPIRGLPLYGMDLLHFFSHEVLLLRVRNNLARHWAQAAKRTFDVVMASMLLILVLPIFVIIALRVKLEEGGAVFYTQERVGKGGSLFRVCKFRSMVSNAHNTLLKWLNESHEIKQEYEGNNFKLRDDPRITKVGKWLRKTSMDELPQLWNVLKGEMSLVGPRPLLEREIPDYGENIDLYKQAKPGITGLWQISGRSETTFSDRANLDAWYVRNWSLWYDIVILIKTVKVVLKRDGAY